MAGVEEIPEGTVKHILAHGKPMARCRVEGSYYAAKAVCPHISRRWQAAGSGAASSPARGPTALLMYAVVCPIIRAAIRSPLMKSVSRGMKSSFAG